MGSFATGVTIVTTMCEGFPHGMTANAVTSVSLDPPLMLFCANKKARTHLMIQNSGIFAVNFLPSSMAELCDKFAGMIGAEEERFEGLNYSTARTGAPIIEGNMGWLDCRVIQRYDGGDHSIFLAEVVDGQPGDGKPMVFFRGKYMTVENEDQGGE